MENSTEFEAKEDQRQKAERRKIGLWRTREQRRHLKRQLEVTDRLLRMVENALQDERELYRYISCSKTGGMTEILCREHQAINEDRLAKIVRALSDLIGIQHEILAVPLFKEATDADNTRAKLESDRDISLRKLEIELMKVDGGDSQAVPEQLLEALSGEDDDP